MTFVCEKCRKQDHSACPGKDWCECQHRDIVRVKS